MFEVKATHFLLVFSGLTTVNHLDPSNSVQVDKDIGIANSFSMSEGQQLV